MKKILLCAVAVAFTLNCVAQNTWEMTEEQKAELKQKQELKLKKEQEKQERKAQKAAMKAAQKSADKSAEKSAQKTAEKAKETVAVKPAASEVDAKYAQGAIPMVNGKVVFEKTFTCKGKSKKQLLDMSTAFLKEMVDEPNQIVINDKGTKLSQLAYTDEAEGVTSARFYEHLVFSSKMLSLDQTDFDYIIAVKCSDGSATMTINRLRYVYEENRPGGWNAPAEEIITDENAFTKNGLKLNRAYGKFRRKTIDRMNYIFAEFEKKLKE